MHVVSVNLGLIIAPRSRPLLTCIRASVLLLFCFHYDFLAHLALCSRSAYAMACCPSSVRPSLAFHIFNISSGTISLMVGGIVATWRVRIAKIAMAAILKFFKLHLLPNRKSDCQSRNLMVGIGATQRFRIAKIVLFQYPRWSPWRPS